MTYILFALVSLLLLLCHFLYYDRKLGDHHPRRIPPYPPLGYQVSRLAFEHNTCTTHQHTITLLCLGRWWA